MTFDADNRAKLEEHAAAASELIKQGEYHAAIEHLTLVLQEAPQDAKALWELAMAYTNLDRNHAALAVLQRLSRLVPGSGELWTAIGCVLIRLGRFQEAKVYLLRAYEADQGNALILRNLGHAYQGLGEVCFAEQALLAAHRLDPDDNRTVHALAQFYMRKRDTCMAEHWVRLLLSRSAPTALAHDAEQWLLRIQSGWA